MQTVVFDGNKMKKELLRSIAQKVAALPYAPLFTDILIGDDPVNIKYVEMKKRVAQKLGFAYKDVTFLEQTSEAEIIAEIQKLNTTPHMAGIIVQLPLPPRFNKDAILNAVAPGLDVDVLGDKASEQFYSGKGKLVLPTAHAVMKILEASGVDLYAKKILILGQGPLVGKPVAYLLAQKSIAFDVVVRQTLAEEKAKLLKNADVIISAMGVPNAILGDMVKEGVVIIDAGTSEMEGSIVGDVHFDSVSPKASFITPSPGGVGPVTIACLFENVCILSSS